MCNPHSIRADGQVRRALLGTTAVSATAHWSTVPAVVLSPSDVAAIRAAEKGLAEAFEASDPRAWVDFYTEDAIFVGPGTAAIEGRGNEDP